LAAERNKMRTLVLFRSLVFSLLLLALSSAALAQIGVSVAFGPPALPVYEQPACPQDGYLWTPGYWAYGDAGYYWVPGTWVEAPEAGFLWTPGYWGWGGNAFLFHEGYWGPHVGFYGGIDYGYGYSGRGYEGGRWENNHFYYNTSVNRVNSETFHNTYNTRIENTTVNRVSYNGGNGGVNARPSAQEDTYSRENHTGPVAAQNQHAQEARSNPELRASENQGKPAIAATSKPGDFKAGAEPAKEAGAPYKKTPEHTPTAEEARPANSSVAPPSANNHASQLQPHKYAAPDNANAAAVKKNQQQQDKLAAKQNQEHQQLQQKQEKEHQQAASKNTNEAQKQQMEQRHTQQTQQLEQKHAAQQQKVQTHQEPHQSAPENHPPKN
jgi:WXXGXW repeat (2 copies)